MPVVSSGRHWPHSRSPSPSSPFRARGLRPSGTSALSRLCAPLTLSEFALQRDVLRARAGLLTSYDPIVEAVADLRGAALALRGAGDGCDRHHAGRARTKGGGCGRRGRPAGIERRDFQVAVCGAAELARLLQLSQRHDPARATLPMLCCASPPAKVPMPRLGGGGGTRSTQSRVGRAELRSADRARTPYCRDAAAGGFPCREHPGRAYRSASAGGTGDIPQRVRPARPHGRTSIACCSMPPPWRWSASSDACSSVSARPPDSLRSRVAHGETDRRDLDGLSSTVPGEGSRRGHRGGARTARRTARSRIARAWSSRRRDRARLRVVPDKSPGSPALSPEAILELAGSWPSGHAGPTVTRSVIDRGAAGRPRRSWLRWSGDRHVALHPRRARRRRVDLLTFDTSVVNGQWQDDDIALFGRRRRYSPMPLAASGARPTERLCRSGSPTPSVWRRWARWRAASRTSSTTSWA